MLFDHAILCVPHTRPAIFSSDFFTIPLLTAESTKVASSSEDYDEVHLCVPRTELTFHFQLLPMDRKEKFLYVWYSVSLQNFVFGLTLVRLKDGPVNADTYS